MFGSYQINDREYEFDVYNDLDSVKNKEEINKITVFGHLSISSNNYSFSEFINLHELYFINNYITILPANMFDLLYNLEILDLSNNNIIELPENIFLNLTNLKELYLNDNNIANLPINIFKDLANLTILNLCCNKLDNINNLFYHLSSLKDLDLSNNRIKELTHELSEKTIFNDNLENLNLGNNNISVISEYAFNNLINLIELNLSENLLDNLPDNIFQNLNKLTDLYLYNNYLSNLPISIINLNLENFSFTGNTLLNIANLDIRNWYDNLDDENLYDDNLDYYHYEFNHEFNHDYNDGIYNNNNDINNNNNDIYNNHENIHFHNIQSEINKSIKWIINRNINPNKITILNSLKSNESIDQTVKDALLEYLKLEDKNIANNVLFADIFYMSYDIIEKYKLESILNEEIKDSLDKCFTGIISRYVNIFNGIIPECTFNITDGTIFQALFSHLRKKYNDKVNDIEVELLDRGYTTEYIKEWIDILKEIN